MPHAKRRNKRIPKANKGPAQYPNQSQWIMAQRYSSRLWSKSP